MTIAKNKFVVLQNYFNEKIRCLFSSKKSFYLRNEKSYKEEVITSFSFHISKQYNLIVGRWRESIAAS